MIILRQWNSDDLLALHEYASDENTASAAAWDVHHTLSETRKVLNHYINSDEVWAIDIDNKAVGCIGLHRRTDGFSRMLEYVVNKDYRGRGVATESVKAAINYAFNDLGVNLITANCYSYNIASEKVLKNCSFKFIKLFPSPKNEIKHYRLTKSDYLKSLQLYDTNAVFK